MRLRIHKGPPLSRGTANFAVDLEFSFDMTSGAVETVDPEGGIHEFVFEVETLFVVDIRIDDHEAKVHAFEIVDGEVGIKQF